MSASLLEMHHIGKAFAGQKVLDEVRFDLRAGEVHVLAGENGAGKSTLMRILSGVYADYDGEIRLQGKTVRFTSPQDAARHGISIIHQELSLIPDMSVSDNIFLGRERTGAAGWLRPRRERAICAALLRRLGVRATPEALVSQYPISIQQTIEIAKALAFDASIIVMDEPTSALTAEEAQRLFEVIAELKAQGRGIVYISHKMEEIYDLADRITVLRDGHHIGSAEATALPRAQLIQWMVGRELSEQFHRDALVPGALRLDLRDFTVPDPAGRPRPAVDKISFSVGAGEIVGLGGLQGSGADVLLNGLYGVYGRLTRGTVLLDGVPYTPSTPRHALRHGLALLSSDRKREGLVPIMGVAHNITLPALPAHSPGGWLRAAREREAALRRKTEFDIRLADLDQPVATLSGGNQQKVVLAKCLETAPRVLLLNEPTRGVDIGAKQDIYRLLNQWSRAGFAVVLITSEMPELIGLSDRIIVLHQGVVTARLTRAQATPETVLAAAMGRRHEDTREYAQV